METQQKIVFGGLAALIIAVGALYVYSEDGPTSSQSVDVATTSPYEVSITTEPAPSPAPALRSKDDVVKEEPAPLPKESPKETAPVLPAPVTQASGLKIETLTRGSGPGAKTGDTVSVDYTGSFTDGKVFDSSIPRGEPFTLTLGAGQVIKGWDQGIVGMQVGETRKLTIPPELAYGTRGYPGAIPPNSTLVFEVTLKAIK